MAPYGDWPFHMARWVTKTWFFGCACLRKWHIRGDRGHVTFFSQIVSFFFFSFGATNHTRWEIECLLYAEFLVSDNNYQKRIVKNQPCTFFLSNKSLDKIWHWPQFLKKKYSALFITRRILYRADYTGNDYLLPAWLGRRTCLTDGFLFIALYRPYNSSSLHSTCCSIPLPFTIQALKFFSIEL